MPKLPDSTPDSEGESPTAFKNTLLNYLKTYNIPCLKPWLDHVKRANFSEVKYVYTQERMGRLGYWKFLRWTKVCLDFSKLLNNLETMHFILNCNVSEIINIQSSTTINWKIDPLLQIKNAKFISNFTEILFKLEIINFSKTLHTFKIEWHTNLTETFAIFYKY